MGGPFEQFTKILKEGEIKDNQDSIRNVTDDII